MKVGFKNTVGRAPSLPFTVHLVGPNGANYESTKSLYSSIMKKDIETLKLSANAIQNATNYITT